MTDGQRDKLLLDISTDVAEVKARLQADFRALYGNGSPGLLARQTEMEKRVLTLENEHAGEARRRSGLIAWLAVLISAASAAWNILRRS